MRPFALLLGLAAVLAAGALLGSVPAASGSGDSASCPTPPTTTTTTGTTPTTTGTTPTTTTTPAPPTIPQPTGDPLNNNTVINCTNNTLQARAKVQVASVHGSPADPVNFAFAYAHDCTTGCQSIAVAFQVALIDRGAKVQTPENYAAAVNYQCHGCGVFAFADQYAIDVPPGTRLSSSTWHEIAKIRRTAQADIGANLTFAQLDTKLHTLAGRLHAAVDKGLRDEHVSGTHRHSSAHLKQSGHN